MDINDVIEAVVRTGAAGPRNRGKPGYPVPQEMLPEDKKKGEDLGFGFNEEGYPLQDKYEFQGMPIAIENKKGSTRKRYDKNGKEKGSTKMRSDYGYVEGAIGSDDEPVDVYIGPDEKAELAYVVHQNKTPDFEEYDEDKVMLGFSSEEEAREAYLRQYDDERFYGGMSSMPIDSFKEKLSAGGKITNESIMRAIIEAIKKPAKSIAHIDDMKPDEFMRFLEKYVDLPIKGGLEVSEKVDGSARITFGVKSGKLFVATKNSGPKTDPAEWGDKPKFRAAKAAHEALASREKEIIVWWPRTEAGGAGNVFVAEVLYTKIPNSIEYGPDVIMIHGIKMGSEEPDEKKSRKIAESLIKAVGKLDGGWLFEYKRIIRPEDVMVDVKNEYTSIKQVYDRLKELEPNRLKSATKERYKAALGSFRSLQSAVKKKLVGQLKNQRSAYGPDGGDVEGLVFRDLESGQMTKLVDKEYFTKLNKFLWQYRELLDKGAEIGGSWEHGVMQKFRNFVADDVLGASVAKTPGFVQYLLRFAEQVKIPDSADTPEKRADYLLSYYIDNHDLMQGDFIERFKSVLERVSIEFTKLSESWKKFSSGDASAKIGSKNVKMDKIVKDRTSEAFTSMEEFLDGVSRSLEVIGAMENDTTKRTATLKLAIGQNRFEKLVVGLKKGDMNEDDHHTRELLHSNVMQMPEKYHKLLMKNGIDVKSEDVLGHGSFGVAFDAKAGGKPCVLKITKDESEARASNHIKGKNTKHVVRISDVFAFPEKRMFGIVQEKLSKIPAYEMEQWSTLINILEACKVGAMMVKGDFDALTKKVEATLMDDGPMALQSFYLLSDKFQLADIIKEIADLGVTFYDYNTGNIMRRGSDYVIIDLGMSRSPGAKPPTLEKVIKETLVNENKADTIGVTIGRFQPFHKGHAEIVRKLASKYTKVIVLVAGLKQDQKNPFSLETRIDLMKKSLPDVLNKVEFHQALVDGKPSGFIPGILSDISINKKSSVTGDSAVTILVGSDRYDDIKGQIDRAREYKKSGGESSFDPELAIVKKIAGVKNDDDTERISGTKVREAFASGDEKAVKELLDPHVASNDTDFKSIFEKLKSEIAAISKPIKKQKKDDVNENVGDIGGETGIESTLKANSDSLMRSKWKIDPSKLKKLGGGMEGIAYDIGSGKVLKITADPKEAAASKRLIGKSLRHVAKIFAVFRFGKTPNINNPMYGIVEEKLQPLTPSEIKEFDDVIDTLHVLVGQSRFTDAMFKGDWEEFLSIIESAYETDIRKELDYPDGSPSNPYKDAKLDATINKRDEMYTNVLVKYKVKEMMEELHRNGIKFADYHGGNLMKRGSDYVINDIGRSESPPGDPIPVFEKIVERVISEIGAMTGPGTTQIGMKAHSSPWSSPSGMMDDIDEPDSTWQNQLTRLEPITHGHALEIDPSDIENDDTLT